MLLQYLSASSAFIGAADGVNSHDYENDAVVASFPSATTPELHSLEISNIVKVSEIL